MTIHYSAPFVPAEWRKPRVRWPAALKPSFMEAQGDWCAICGEPILSPERANFDHVRPLARQGRDELGNLVLAHRHCNAIKGDRWPTGCEVIFVCLVNEALGLWERPATRVAA